MSRRHVPARVRLRTLGHRLPVCSVRTLARQFGRASYDARLGGEMTDQEYRAVAVAIGGAIVLFGIVAFVAEVLLIH